MSATPVHVRMYRRLLGDCFLLTIGAPSADRKDRTHILIDCGILQSSPRERELIRAAAEDIRHVVGDYIDLLVITHEHWDHISGFSHARDLLIDTVEIRNLWLAWTERRGDEQADAYRAKSKKAKEVVARLAATPKGKDATAGLPDFDGATEGRLRGGDIIPALIAKATATGSVQYLEPGQVLDTPGPTTALRANVLGPPRDPARLTKDLPSKGDAKETYLTPNFVKSLSLRYAMADTLDDALKAEGVGPFVSAFRRTPDHVHKSDGREAKWLRNRYLSDANSWRRIDDDWLTAGGSLALKLDSDTNSTSLVLAFEVEPGGEVLLFAADAQVGNWLSWHDQPYPHPSENGVTSATAIDLLRRTILYKVGHHASHNATLEEAGLELMVHPGLTAMIPVDEGEARRVNAEGNAVHRGWDMPYPELYARLIEKTDGRVLRGDAEAGFDPRGVRICKDAELLGRVQSTAIFHEVRVA